MIEEVERFLNLSAAPTDIPNFRILASAFSARARIPASEFPKPFLPTMERECFALDDRVRIDARRINIFALH